jgi:hypothetical protein
MPSTPPSSMPKTGLFMIGSERMSGGLSLPYNVAGASL